MPQQQQTKTLKMMYSGNLELISCPIKAKYEECIEIACQRFEIPFEFKNHIQISNGSRYIFEKYTFEYFNLLFPSPEIIFYIKLDYNGLLGTLGSESDDRVPFTKLHNKRRISIEYEGVPVTRQNCFIGSLDGNNDANTESSEEPKPKKQRIIVTTSKYAVKKISSRKSIRV
ncbi:uncharacterized protein LOC129909260 [Episyrphus balteatus]|uniref:uncharacterized protein LOC129909260 n=1 Tax=Episyrphus balteatus TaxID=286459 RepID=UPI00248557C8|nr:uncharacterized protein LOC129909260 [Episyrphus balteatus]